MISDSLSGRILSKCQLFSMVYEENISIREVALLRGMIEYIDQAVLEVNYGNILHTLTTYHEISRLFVDYFLTKFDPVCISRTNALKSIETELDEKIKAVPNIMDDKILKITYSLLKNMLRTNYFLYREAIAFKIDQEVRTIIGKAHNRAREIMTTHRDILEQMADQLVQKESLSEAEVEALMEPLTAVAA